MSALADAAASQRTDTSPGFKADPSPGKMLARAAQTWFATALVGQLIFSLYIVLQYGGAMLTGETARWNRIMPKGHVPGDTLGNAAIAAHVLLAVLIMLGGALQLMPAIRRRVPALHRWVGRSYIVAVTLTSVAGLYMIWWRGGTGDLSQHIAISLNAAILVTCAVLAWRNARARDFVAHRQWALRAYLAANGVFFFRLGLFLWLIVNRGPVGFNPTTFSGPFLTILAFAVYVFVPLGVLQLYFTAQRSQSVAVQRSMSVGVFVLSLLTAAGIASVSMILWIPVMRS
jgi:uncharacterized membrane protein